MVKIKKTYLNKKLAREKRIEFEDVFSEQDPSEAQGFPEGKHLGIAIEKKILYFPLMILVFVFGAVLFRVIYLQIKDSAHFEALAERAHSRVEWLLPHRGIIYGRSGEQLVYNIPVYHLYANGLEDLETEISKIKAIFPNIQNIESLIENAADRRRVLVKKNLTDEEVFRFKALEHDFDNFFIQSIENRDYVDSHIFSHILGYVGKITQEELKGQDKIYLLDDYIGKAGIEYEYENILRGDIGIKNTEINPSQKQIRPLRETEPRDGVNIQLSIDSKLQRKSYEVLSNLIKSQKLTAGAIIALDPKNGEVLTLISLPSYNNNLLSQGISLSDFLHLQNHPNRPFFNRAISGMYPPGSTIKPVIALAALEQDIISPSDNVRCQGFLRVANIYNPSISYIFRDWKTHGITNLKKALAESCNIYFYMIGGGYENFEGLGIKRIKEYADKIYLGRQSGIDLPGESYGLIPDKNWKKRVKKEDWYIGDTYHVSIGQGDTSLTPLQVAQIYTFFANSGKLYRPHILAGIQETPEGKFNQIDPEIIVSGAEFEAKNIEAIRQGLRETVISGSAQILKNLPVSSAAKTGTAQFGDGSNSHAWFASFAPFENPEIVLVVLVEEGGGGSGTAAPVAYEILNWYFTQEK